jgi:putative redox protein
MSDLRRATVRWTGRDLVFEGRTATSAPILIDSASKAGPSPTETLLMSIAACMAIDVKVILEKSRIDVEEIVVEMEGDRAPEPPRRFTSIALTFKVKGPTEKDLPKLERAAQLSRDKYCSVFHTLRSDIDVRISTSLA